MAASLPNSSPAVAPGSGPVAGLRGLDGLAVEKLLQGAVLKGYDPRQILRGARIDPSVYGDERGAIDGSALFRLVDRIQRTLDDSFIGFLPERFRLALEEERTRAHFHAGTFGDPNVIDG